MVLGHDGAERQQRLRGFGEPCGLGRLDRAADFGAHFAVDGQIVVFGVDRLGERAFPQTAIGFQKHLRKSCKAPARVTVGQGRAVPGDGPHACCGGPQTVGHPQDRVHTRAVEARHGAARHARLRIALVQPRRLAKARQSAGSLPGGQPVRIARQAEQPSIQRAIRLERGEMMQRARHTLIGAGPFQQAVPGVLQHARAFQLVQRAEARQNARLHRKAPDHALAEGVDRHHLQPFGRFQRAGEQAPRLGQVQRTAQRVHGLAEQVAQILAQHGVGLDRPFGQAFEQTLLHLGGGRAGIGQAQDLARLGSLQQNARHTVHQDLGLAGSRIGVHHARRAWIGSEALQLRGRFHRHAVRHAHSWGPAACHSSRRARSSYSP